MLQLTDGKGMLLKAVLQTAHKKHAVVSVVERSQQVAPEQEVVIAVSLLKNTARIEWFLEKAVELGMIMAMLGAGLTPQEAEAKTLANGASEGAFMIQAASLRTRETLRRLLSEGEAGQRSGDLASATAAYKRILREFDHDEVAVEVVDR